MKNYLSSYIKQTRLKILIRLRLIEPDVLLANIAHAKHTTPKHTRQTRIIFSNLLFPHQSIIFTRMTGPTPLRTSHGSHRNAPHEPAILYGYTRLHRTIDSIYS